MAAQARHFPYFSRGVGSRQSLRWALYGGAAIIVAAVGVLSLISASAARRFIESWIDIHVLFGLLLGSLVFARFRWRLTHSPGLQPSDIRKLSRHLSHLVYLMLYVVIGARLGIGVLDFLWHGGASGFGPSATLSIGVRPFPTGDYQLFFASGLCVLVAVRVLAGRLGVRLGRTAAP